MGKLIDFLTGKNRLVCSQCKHTIYGEKIAFNPEYKELYHPNCASDAVVVRVFNSGKADSGCIYQLSREQALRVKSKLEEKTKKE